VENDKPIHLSVNEGYNRWSEFYDQDDIPLHLLEERVVDEALGQVSDLDIVDLGCGTGRQTLRLADKGARAVGVDQSEGMLEKARSKTSKSDIRFLKWNLDNGIPFDDDSFDRVVSFLALEHIANLQSFFFACRRVCRSEGFIYFTAMHPAMVLRGVQARFTEAETGKKVYPKSFPYRISDYLNSALDAGLRLGRMTEHATDNSHSKQSERALKYEGWPLLLTIKFFPNKDN
jgi:ubiquinone/menaquinone biosynthesis C-methylase UbiE